MGIRSHGTGIGNSPFPSYMLGIVVALLVSLVGVPAMLERKEKDALPSAPVPPRETGCRLDKLEEGEAYSLAGRTYKCVVVAGYTGLVHQTSSGVITFLPPPVSRRETELDGAKRTKEEVE